MPTKNRSKSETLKELETRIERVAVDRKQEIFAKGFVRIEGFCKTKGISVESMARALLDDPAQLYKEIKTNIINEIVEQASSKEEK